MENDIDEILHTAIYDLDENARKNAYLDLRNKYDMSNDDIYEMASGIGWIRKRDKQEEMDI